MQKNDPAKNTKSKKEVKTDAQKFKAIKSIFDSNATLAMFGLQASPAKINKAVEKIAL